MWSTFPCTTAKVNSLIGSVESDAFWCGEQSEKVTKLNMLFGYLLKILFVFQCLFLIPIITFYIRRILMMEKT